MHIRYRVKPSERFRSFVVIMVVIKVGGRKLQACIRDRCLNRSFCIFLFFRFHIPIVATCMQTIIIICCKTIPFYFMHFIICPADLKLFFSAKIINCLDFFFRTRLLNIINIHPQTTHIIMYVIVVLHLPYK